MANIDVYKNVANTSSDAYAVQCAMDELLRAIDFIMSYGEEELHLAGKVSELLFRDQRDAEKQKRLLSESFASHTVSSPMR